GIHYHVFANEAHSSASGVLTAPRAAKSHNGKLLVTRARLMADRYKIASIAHDRASYGRLCYLITLARRQAEKGAYCLTRQQFAEAFPCGCSLIYLPYEKAASAAWPFSEQGKSCLANVEASASDKENTVAIARWLKSLAAKRCWIGVSLHCDGRQAQQINRLRILSKDSGIPLVATGDVHMSMRRERVLQDTLTAIRCNKPLSALGEQLYANGERHLRSLSELAAIYPADCLEASLHIADLADFSLDSLRYEYPREIVPIEHSPNSWLRQLTYKGAHQRYPDGISDTVKALIEHELSLIAELGYEPFFLTVHDIVQFARSQNILCQGRGSAANSAVCYCLGITAVDPGRLSLLFERFISRERNEPPDIDVDFENARREEVIQYIYQRYGRHRTALAATYITYRKKSAFRDVAKALGFRLDQIEQMTKQLSRLDDKNNLAERLRAAGFDPEQTKIQQLMTLVKMIEGAPRHLSQHVGGFVIARDRLDHLVPIENAAMDGRTVIQWDKDDLEALGLIKVDVLALGMLTAIRHCFELLKQHRGIAYSLATIPAEDAATYRMIQQADTVGVFQIESRAQMSMLPRLKPACFYDLVIEVAIVRPGPI
ncbi:error-prone DNA polymerase, partial [bacterium]|nr:error-prone DNA polymerase [bacterium]